MSVTSGQSIAVTFTTRHPSTGSGVDADFLPSGIVNINGLADPTTVTITNAGTGEYKAAFTLPALVTGDRVDLRISATVGGVSDKAIVWRERCDVNVDSRLAPTVPGRTVDVSTGGNIGIDWSNVENPTTTLNLSGTTIAVVTTVDTVTGLTASRLGYLDNLNVGGLVASAAGLSSIADSVTARIRIEVPRALERPESGSAELEITIRLADTNGNPVDATGDDVTITAMMIAGNVDVSDRLGSITNPATGVYKVSFAYDFDDSISGQMELSVEAVLPDGTWEDSAYVMLTDDVAIAFSQSHADKIAAIYDKLPSANYLTGTSDSGGAILTVAAIGSGGITTSSFANAVFTSALFATGTLNAVQLAASQPSYAPAKAGDAMALTSGERSTLYAGIVTAINADATIQLLQNNASNAITKLDTLLVRLSADRANALDYLTGPIATYAQVDALTGFAEWIEIAISASFEIPDSGTQNYFFDVITRDEDGNPVDPYDDPEVTLAGNVTSDLTSLITQTTHVGDGHYRYRVTLTTSTLVEQVRLDVTATVEGDDRSNYAYFDIVNQTADVFTSADRTALSGLVTSVGLITAKLPSKTYLVGTNNATGAVQFNDATGNYPGTVGGINGVTFPAGFDTFPTSMIASFEGLMQTYVVPLATYNQFLSIESMISGLVALAPDYPPDIDSDGAIAVQGIDLSDLETAVAALQYTLDNSNINVDLSEITNAIAALNLQVVFAPLNSSVIGAQTKNTFGATEAPLRFFRHETGAIAFAVFDTSRQPVELTYSLISMTVYDADNTVEHYITSDDSEMTITITGDDYNVVNISITSDMTSTPTSTWRYAIRDAESGVMIRHGDFIVEDTPALDGE